MPLATSLLGVALYLPSSRWSPTPGVSLLVVVGLPQFECGRGVPHVVFP